MPRRPATTLFLVTRQRIYRADVGAGAHSSDAFSLDRGDAHDLASTLELALVSGPPAGRTVYVLSTDFWLQTLALPAGRVTGLTEPEIAQALNFEAEELSGLSAHESTCAVAALPSTGAEKRFLLLQIRTSDRNRVAELLKNHGSRLAGLLHPGGLPRGIGQNALRSRIELWPDAAVGVRRSGDQFDLAVSNADPMTGRWRADLQDWAGSELLTGPGVPTPADTEPVRLEKLETLGDWFSQWAGVLAQRKSGLPIPVLRPPAPPTPPAVRIGLGVGLTAVVAAGIFLHWSHYRAETDELSAHLAAANKESKRLTDLEAQTKTQEKDRDKAKEEATRVEQLSKSVKNQGERYAQLLELCAKHKPAGVMIQKIEGDKAEPKIIGLARWAELPDEFARDLTAPVRELGWELQLSQKTAQKKVVDGAPWVFEIHFRPLNDPHPPPPPKGKR